jgi:hypothetical protein
VGEPQGPFGDTGEVQTVLVQLGHYGVQLWVPELGGLMDPTSEILDLSVGKSVSKSNKQFRNGPCALGRTGL